MYILAGLLIGAYIGYRRAAKRGGNGFDKAQYAAVHGILLALVGLFLTVALNRLA